MTVPSSSEATVASASHVAGIDLFEAYQKTFCSTTNEHVVWWYCGTVSSHIEGLGEVPISQAETIMVFDTSQPDADTLKITWKEVGYFRDIATGEVLTSWFNPFTGTRVERASSFEDGPAYYCIRRIGEGLDISLLQSHARVDGVSLQVSAQHGQVGFIQTEDKTRTYQRADGSWPLVDSKEATSIRTVLSIFSSLDDLKDKSISNAPAAGFYRSGGVGESQGEWRGTVVNGVMRKTADSERLNPIAWDRMEQLYPKFFRAGKVDPGWDRTS